jgi:hypothetical protein
MNFIGGIDVWLLLFLASTLDEGELSNSRSDLFTNEEKPQYPLNRKLSERPQKLPGHFGE